MNIDIFVVNLKKDLERYKHMQILAKKYNLKFNFIKAIDGKKLSKNLLNDINKHISNKENIGLTAEEIGCAYSHLLIYKKIVIENIKYALILEDDITFDDSIYEIIQNINNFPIDWECVLLFHNGVHFQSKECYVDFHNQHILNDKYKLTTFTDIVEGTAGYIINSSGALKLLKLLKQGIQKPIDTYTGNSKHLNLYGVYPKVINLDTKFLTSSHIDYGRKKKWKNRNRGFIYKIAKKIYLLQMIKMIDKQVKIKNLFICFYLFIIKYYDRGINEIKCYRKTKKI